MNIGRILFVVIFFLSTATLLTVASALEAVKDSFGMPPDMQRAIYLQQKQQQLQEAYKKNLLGIVENYANSQAPLSQEKVTELENRLLALSVPADLQDLHFQLITALENFGSAPPVKQETRQRLQELFQQYSWLTSSFTFFILNNY